MAGHLTVLPARSPPTTWHSRDETQMKSPIVEMLKVKISNRMSDAKTTDAKTNGTKPLVVKTVGVKTVGVNTADMKALLKSVAAEEMPLPGSGQTPLRHARLMDLGRQNLPLARLAEAHFDAVAILAEAHRQPENGALYGVWARCYVVDD